MTRQGRRVLVTGAGGFVGSHLVECLVRSEWNVRCCLRYNSRNDIGMISDLPKDARAELEIIRGDLRDPESMIRAVAGVDVVFHLGALIAIPYSYQNPREVVETNVMGTLNVLSAAHRADVERFVHTSTSEVYGSAVTVPIDERHPLQGQSPYSASKIGADKIVESYYASFGLPVTTIRPFNIYGPRQSARAVIPTIIGQALSGSEIRLGSLTPTRDFTFVEDTVDGFVKIVEADDAIGGTFNVGSNFEISIGDLAKEIVALTGSDADIVQDETRVRPEKSEVRRLLADNTLAGRTFGWRPTVSLRDGLKRTMDWIGANPGRYDFRAYTT